MIKYKNHYSKEACKLTEITPNPRLPPLSRIMATISPVTIQNI